MKRYFRAIAILVTVILCKPAQAADDPPWQAALRSELARIEKMQWPIKVFFPEAGYYQLPVTKSMAKIFETVPNAQLVTFLTGVLAETKDKAPTDLSQYIQICLIAVRLNVIQNRQMVLLGPMPGQTSFGSPTAIIDDKDVDYLLVPALEVSRVKGWAEIPKPQPEPWATEAADDVPWQATLRSGLARIVNMQWPIDGYYFEASCCRLPVTKLMTKIFETAPRTELGQFLKHILSETKDHDVSNYIQICLLAIQDKRFVLAGPIGGRLYGPALKPVDDRDIDYLLVPQLDAFKALGFPIKTPKPQANP